MNENEFEELTRIVIENLIEAHTVDNYRQASQYFSEALKGEITLQEFTIARKKYPDKFSAATSINFLGAVKSNDRTICLWRAINEVQEVLWQIHLSKSNDINNIIGLKFL